MSETLEALEAITAARTSQNVAVRELVDQARQEGHSWERIGRALGVTKQAAQQQFGRVKVIEP